MKAPARIPLYLKTIWEEVEGEFRPTIGESGLEAVCGLLFQLRDSQKRIESEGVLVVDDKGRAAQHPAIAVELAAQSALRLWRDKFGIKPREK